MTLSRPEEVILEAVERFGEERLALAASWQKETAVLVDLVRRHAPGARIFTLDTGVLFEETYATWRAVEERYGITIESWRGEWVHGLWATEPDRCCFLRKVEPLQRALEDADCWISGVRREQSADRAATEELGWDDRHGLWKANPLATWTEREVWAYIARHDLPYNPLHDQGYDSIGCTHCTLPGRGRDGRWAGLSKNECGMHLPMAGRARLELRGTGAAIFEPVKTADTRWHDGAVTAAERAAALGFKGATVWMTGLPASGKSTLAVEIEALLVGAGRPALRLDGDNLRHGLNGDLGFSAEDRAENVRRTAHAAALLAEAGVVALVALVSPYAADREAARAIHAAAGLPFLEVYVATPLAECERRDPKGLYARARAGELPGLTGVGDVYEVPRAPDVEIGDAEPIAAAAARILAELR